MRHFDIIEHRAITKLSRTIHDPHASQCHLHLLVALHGSAGRDRRADHGTGCGADPGRRAEPRFLRQAPAAPHRRAAHGGHRAQSRARGIRARPLSRVRPRRSELPRVSRAAQFSKVCGARDPHARRSDLRPARGPPSRRQGLTTLRRPGAGGFPWLRAFGKGPRRGGLRQRRQPRRFPAPGPHGHRSQGQDRADAVLEPVLVPRLQGLRGRATRRSGNDHLLRPCRGRIPARPGLSRWSLGSGIAHRVGRDHLRLARAGRAFHVSLETAAGRPLGGRAAARQAAAAHPVDAAQCA